MPPAVTASAPGVLTQRQRLAAAALPGAALLVGVLAPKSRVAAALTLAGPLAALASSVVLTRASEAARKAAAAARRCLCVRTPGAEAVMARGIRACVDGLPALPRYWSCHSGFRLERTPRAIGSVG